MVASTVKVGRHVLLSANHDTTLLRDVYHENVTLLELYILLLLLVVGNRRKRTLHT